MASDFAVVVKVSDGSNPVIQSGSVLPYAAWLQLRLFMAMARSARMLATVCNNTCNCVLHIV